VSVRYGVSGAGAWTTVQLASGHQGNSPSYLHFNGETARPLWQSLRSDAETVSEKVGAKARRTPVLDANPSPTSRSALPKSSVNFNPLTSERD
jgi:hypothetical protein